jgi:biotin carboxylase
LNGVAAYLEQQRYVNVVGCDSLFIQNTLTKNGMKVLFQQHLVACPPGCPATVDTDLEALVQENGLVFPLFVKISDSYGSVGLDDDSVCHDLSQLKRKCAGLLQEFPELTIEEFIDGPEFSVLVSGNCRDPEQTVIVYPPAGALTLMNRGTHLCSLCVTFV